MATLFQQTDTAAILDPSAAPTNLPAHTNDVNREMKIGGTVGVMVPVVGTTDTPPQLNKLGFSLETALGEPGLVTWLPGTWTVKMEVTVGDPQLTWRRWIAYRISSTGVILAIVATSDPAVQILLTNPGIFTLTSLASTERQSSGSTDDRLLVALFFDIAASMPPQFVRVRPSQTITAPFTVPTDPLLGGTSRFATGAGGAQAAYAGSGGAIRVWAPSPPSLVDSGGVAVGGSGGATRTAGGSGGTLHVSS